MLLKRADRIASSADEIGLRVQVQSFLRVVYSKGQKPFVLFCSPRVPVRSMVEYSPKPILTVKAPVNIPHSSPSTEPSRETPKTNPILFITIPICWDASEGLILNTRVT